MADDAFDRLDEAENPFDAGVPVRFDLFVPCAAFSNGLKCGLIEAYLQVKPYGTSFHYERRCATGHFVDNVKHVEVELHFGIRKTAGESTKAMVRDALTPPRRVAFNVTLRDNFTCVYCGQRVGDAALDGSLVVVGADHLIAKALIEVDDIRRDRELLLFARDRQLVTACRSHNSTKQSMLIDLDVARDLFVRHVLKGQSDGVNRSQVAMLERLHRIVALRLRLNGKAR